MSSLRIAVAYVTIVVLAQKMSLPIPHDLLRVLDPRAFAGAALFASAWAATQDVSSSSIALGLFITSLVLFHKKDSVQDSEVPPPVLYRPSSRAYRVR